MNAAGTGFLAALLFLESHMSYSHRPPGAAYYTTVYAGLTASLGVIASTLPLLKRITGARDGKERTTRRPACAP
jgi:hypothetical protein